MRYNVIAIDGRAASGKTTFANCMAETVFGKNDRSEPVIIRMDYFFLPPELRTAERLAQPGGNIHHERFVEEVLPFIRTGQEFEYRIFDCSRMDYNGVAKIPAHPWRIIEGVYSCHPALGDYMDVRVFMDIRPEQQQGRIKKRNSPKIAADYLTKWIPMEEAYFKAYKIREAADIVL